MTDASDDLPGFLMFLRQPSTTSTAVSASVVLSDWDLGYNTERTPGNSTEGTRIKIDAVPSSSTRALLIPVRLRFRVKVR